MLIVNELQVIEFNKNHKFFIKKMKDDRILLGISYIRTIFIIKKNDKRLVNLLKGYIVTKNAGILGLIINKLIILILNFINIIPLTWLRKLDIDTDFHLISWRKGARYRFINLNTNIIVDLLKNKNDNSIQKEINARLNYSKYISISRLISYTNDKNSFEQELIQGKSLLSLSNNITSINETLGKIFTQLVNIYNKTLKEINFKQYIQKIMLTINHTQKIRKKDKQKILAISYLLEKYTIQKFYLCDIHGDLNLGNIIVNKNEYYLIDWERSSVKSASHDFFNLYWFINHVHSKTKVNFDEIKNISFFNNTIKLNDTNYFQAYEIVYFLEKINMWIVYPESNYKWLKKIIKIMNTKIKNDFEIF